MDEALTLAFADRAKSLPGVVAIWTHGSLARHDVVQGSDADLRIGLDVPHHMAWQGRATPEMRRQFYDAFGQQYAVVVEEPAYSRLITFSGDVIDLGAEPVSDDVISHLTRSPIEVLWVTPGLSVVGIDPGTMRDQFPAPQIAKERLEEMMLETLVVMLGAPSAIARGNILAARLGWALQYVELAKMAYAVEGVEWAKGSKHIDEWLGGRTQIALAADASSARGLFNGMLMLLEILGAEKHAALVEACWARFIRDLDAASAAQ